jgi:long-subunit fatty acid transport protein
MDVPAPNRFDLISSDGLIVYPTLGFGWRAHPRIDVGAEFQAVLARFKFVQMLSLARAIEDPDADTIVRLEASDWFTPTGMLGIKARPVDRIELGASLRLPFSINASGETQVEEAIILESIAGQVSPNPAATTLEFDMPLVLRAGVRYAHPRAATPQGSSKGDKPPARPAGSLEELFDVELDLVYERWSALQSFLVTLDAAIVKRDGSRDPLEPVPVPHRYDDTVSVRLGGSFNPGALSLRAGAFFETAGVPARSSRIDFSPFQRFGFGAGLAYRIGRFGLSAAFGLVLNRPRQVSDSQIFLTDSLAADHSAACTEAAADPTMMPCVPIGNGRFEATMRLISIGLEARL